MANTTSSVTFGGIDVGPWLTGAGAGAVGAVLASLVLFATGEFELSAVSIEAFGVLFVPGAVFGLLYAAIVHIDWLAERATEPRPGALLGLVYGGLFWLTTVTGDVGIGGLLASLTFGVVIGLLYALSPYTG